MSGISGVGVTPTLPANVTDALQTDSTAAANALATLYALSFAGGDTAAAIGLTAPSNFGDVEALLAEISAQLDLTKAEAETTQNLTEVEQSRSETINLSVLINNLGSNRSTKSSLDKEISNWAGSLFGLTSLENDQKAVSALIFASSSNSVGSLNKALEKRDDALQDPVEGNGVEENKRTEEVIEDAIEDPAKQEEMLQELKRIRDRLVEGGLNAEAANRVAGIGAALTGGIATVLATIERLTGDAALFSQAAGAPQGDQRVKVTI